MFVNLTPHAIKVESPETGEVVSFPPSGVVARVSVGTIDCPNVQGFRRSVQVFGNVVDLPEPADGVVYIVSGMVLGRVTGRDDVVAPDTGRDAVRNGAGQIDYVKGFV